MIDLHRLITVEDQIYQEYNPNILFIIRTTLAMNRSINLIYQRLLTDTSLKHFRSLYDSFDLNERLIGLTGPRGVGKTTLLLQLIKTKFANPHEVFYFSADHIYFDTTTLYTFIENLYLEEGIKTFFIDEIHQYENWSQEIKNIYDGFPAVKIIFSGSSSLDITKGSYDLSRRAKMYNLAGLSFREFLKFHYDIDVEKIEFNQLMNNHRSYDSILPDIDKIKGYFNEYLRNGYYPFYLESSLSFHEKLLNVIDKTIHEDIANFYNLKTKNLHHFKKILGFLALMPPGNVNVHNLAKNLSIDDKTVSNYLTALQETGFIHLIYAAEGGNAGLRRPEKIFLDNTNLQYAIEGTLANKIDIGSIRELFFIQAVRQADLTVHHSKLGDYTIDGYTFEIGGKNKNRQQIKGVQNAFLVKDDILISSRHEIPLMLFGLLY